MDRYLDLEMLGSGILGSVFKAQDKITGEIVIIKKCNLHDDEGIPTTLIREISLLKELQHPNIHRLFDVIYLQPSLTLILEYMDQDLSQYIEMCKGGLEPAIMKSFLFQLLRGMTYCHHNHVLHRDLKPQHLLINREGELKVAEFNMARTFSIMISSFPSEMVSLWYRAPELLLGSRKYSTPIDIWSIGCIFAEMCNGRALFRGNSEKNQLERIFSLLGLPSEEDYPTIIELPDWADTKQRMREKALQIGISLNPPANFAHLVGETLARLDPQGVVLLSQMLQLDPAKRISARKAMEHSYFDILYSGNPGADGQAQLERSASERASSNSRPGGATAAATTRAGPGPSKLGRSSSSNGGGGKVPEEPEKPAVFSGVKRTSSSPATTFGAASGGGASALATKEYSSMFGKGLNNMLGTMAVVERHWGRPDRLRTESGENDLYNPQYRFRTSSSADLIQLLNLTSVFGVQMKNLTHRSPQLKSNMPRVPSFLKMDVNSGKNEGAAATPRMVSNVAQVTQQNQPEKVQVRRPRRNTSNSLLIDTLMSKPDTEVQIRCVAFIVHAQMVRFALAHRKSGDEPSAAILARFDVFNEDYGKPPGERQKIAAAFEASIDLSSVPGGMSGVGGIVPAPTIGGAGVAMVAPASQQTLRRILSEYTAGSLERQLLTRNQSKDAPPYGPSVPDKETIADFIGEIFSKAQMEAVTIIMLLIYVERLLEATKGKLELTMRNWQPIVSACMILASKVWDDLSMWNSDFSLVSHGNFNVKRINELEIALLQCLWFNVRVPASTYAKYYFQLRAMREHLGEAPEKVQELSMEKASKLETLSDRYQNVLGVDWEGPRPKKAKEKKNIGPGKHPEERMGIRKRSNTLGEGVSSEMLERMHRIGPSFAVHVPTASLEQVVAGKHELERGEF